MVGVYVREVINEVINMAPLVPLKFSKLAESPLSLD